MAGHDWPHTRWEYMLLDVWPPADVMECLNERGLSGWQAWYMDGLVSTTTKLPLFGTRIFFKRELTD